jgi:hypothetical protein
MSLAITAASVENDYNDSNNYNNISETPVNRKRTALNNNHNRTQKRVLSDFNPEKVNSVLESIYSTMDVTGELADYNPRDIGNTLQKVLPINPLKPPESAKSGYNNMNNGKDLTKNNSREGMSNITNNGSGSSNSNSSVPQPLHNDSMELQELNQAFLNDAQVRDYYRKLSPTYNPHKPLSTDNSNSTKGSGDIKISDYSNNGNNDILLNKLNYMINLLENQQDDRTNNVTEEVVLYSFLGVFIIFVVDSFARVGKYVR